jgi:mannose-6-phosphate isomerase-like protein (cupin superfamily)
MQPDGEDRPIEEGSIVCVSANMEHRFHSLEQPLEIRVVFAPADGSRRVPARLQA